MGPLKQIRQAVPVPSIAGLVGGLFCLVGGYFSQSSGLYGVQQAPENSFYAFLDEFDALCSKKSVVQESLRAVNKN